jgi:thiamine biosynthesis lipoprotein
MSPESARDEMFREGARMRFRRLEQTSALPSWPRLTRCRPLLDTLVTIEVAGPGADHQDALDAAFAAMGRVHRAMSAQSPESDLGRIARSAHLEPVEVDPWTYEVLEGACRFARESMGAIDPTVGAQLVRWGFLPLLEGAPTADPRASFADLVLKDGRVGAHRPVRLDLGGLAKGFAVDRAVDVLRAAGLPQGLVDARDDLRTWGAELRTVGIRHPAAPQRIALALELGDGAIASVGTAWGRRKVDGRVVTPFVRPWDGEPKTALESVCALAPTAFAADALARILLLRRHRALGDFQRHRAAGFRIDVRGQVYAVDGSEHAADQAA